MRQKFLISKNRNKGELRITEYAILDKDLKKVASENLRKDHYTLLCKETYKSEFIVKAIARGKDALVQALRTNNIYPIRPYADEIAETIRGLYTLVEDDSIELFFDDMNIVSVE